MKSLSPLPRGSSQTDTYVFKQAYKEALADWAGELIGKQLLTLHFNRPATILGVQVALKRFAARLDRYSLGPLWAKKRCGRADLLFFAEHLESNAHIHGGGRLPEKASRLGTLDLIDLLSTQWAHSVPGGTIYFDQSPDSARWAQYITKLALDGKGETLLLTRENWPAPRPLKKR